MKKLLLFLFVIACAVQQSHSQNINITLAAQLPYPTQNLSNIWGWKSPVDGKEYALVGAANGLSIVDVSNPFAPTEIVQIPGASCSWREIRTLGNYAYVADECGTNGLLIVDLINLPSPTLTTATWTPSISTQTLETIHALQIDNGKVYLYGTNVGAGGAVVADIATTPMAPVYLGTYDAGGYIHDGYVRNDTMYAGHIWAGAVGVVNMANPASGVPLASFMTPGAFTHNTWLSADGNFCFTTDEVSGGMLAAFDISNLSNITQTDAVLSNAGGGSVVHNTYIKTVFGIEYAITSWYKDGITIVNVSNPANIFEVGNYDTAPTLSGSGYGGCWGVYPYLPSGTILASDMQNGLFVLQSPLLTTHDQLAADNMQFTIYPNPSNGIFTIDSKIADGEVQVYNLLGEKVYSSLVINNTTTINLAEAAKGIYFVNVQSEKGAAVQKLVIQ